MSILVGLFLGRGTVGKVETLVVLHLIGIEGLDAFTFAKSDAKHLFGDVELLVNII